MSFPCISCSIVLPNSNEQRNHYKGDWHRYNLKRKVAGLPPVSLDEFELKSSLFAKPDEGIDEKTKAELPHCAVCHKKFNSQKAYENHTSSRKHQQKVIEASANASVPQQQQHKQQSNSQKWISEKNDDEDDDGDDDDDEETPLGLEECLFCSHISADAEANCGHMLKHHGFMLPNPDYVNDLEGLLTLLDYKVGVGYECLWCHASRHFDSLRSVQQHMLDSGHCKYNMSGEHAFDLADFYDFGDSALAGGNGDEDDDDDSSTVMQDDYDSADVYELVLPSGAVCGHRSLMRYFKQSLPPQRSVALASSSSSSSHRLLSQYKAIGWSGSAALALRTTAQAAAIRDLKFVQRHRQRMRQKLGCKANKLQHHYREQNPI